METIVINGKEKMKSICAAEDCTSCMACYSACPAGAITIGTDEQGFYRPQIDSNKCVGCRRCVQVCPAHGHISKNKPHKALAAYIRDEEIRKASTSGGAFSVLAEYVIQKGGAVFGAAFDKDYVVRHIAAETDADVSRIRTSKYVQCSVGGSFREAKHMLDAGREVLFTGTPCQINGLKQYLRKDYENLLTADIICHGTPTPKFFAEYLRSLEKQHDSPIKSVRFRYKTDNKKKIGDDCYYNMLIEFNEACYGNSKTCCLAKNEDPYLRGFFSNLFLNPACYHCHFATAERAGDFTIADFWGFRAPSVSWVDTGKGTSLILVNTDKAEAVFKEVSPRFRWCERPLEEAIAGNPHLSYPISKGEKYDEFWKDYRARGYEYVREKYFEPIPLPKDSTVTAVKKMIPLKAKWVIKRMLGKV